MEKYSLWLRPEGETANKLRALIAKLATQYGTSVFEPHITYLGDLNLSKEEALLKTFQISSQLRPFIAELNELDYTENYFRCVFIKAKKTKFLKEIAMPHLSLIYGNLSIEVKKKIIAELGSLSFKLKINSIYLTNSSRFTKIKDWKVLAEFPFEVVDALKKGKIGVIPTDTIYGIVGSAFNKKTVEKIYFLRKRSKNKPFITLISSLKDLDKFSIKLTKKQEDFLKKIWPNPVSVVLGNLAFRMPKDMWLLSLLEEVGPLVAPSANFEGEKPSQTITEAKKYFGSKVSFYIDKGKIKSQASTLLELNGDSIKILRQGSFLV